ncbi:uncharacterized protein LOC142008961 [Carettochelys insculpta]|uniref:uncharacterized protein LOC142008961 n=1 Tax=Carettochelys insculpta TaxID=44489 RepID=UPI003EBCE559
MESCHQCVLLLVVVAAATAMGPSPHRTLSYEEAVAQAVDFYNQAQGTDHAFRLLKADPQPEWDMTSNPRQALKFTIKETVCPASQTPHGTECDFSDNGVVRDCSGFFSTEQMSPVVIISCNTVTQQVAPTQLALNPTGHRMQTYLQALLIVGLVTAAPTPSSVPLPSHEDALLAAVQVYNQDPGLTLRYRLLEAEPQPDWDMTSRTVQPLKFSIKETVCLVSDKRDINQCEYKEDGLIKDCSGFFSTEQDPPSAIIKCEEASEEEPELVTRGRWSRFRRKVGGFIRKHRWQIVSAGLRLFG